MPTGGGCKQNWADALVQSPISSFRRLPTVQMRRGPASDFPRGDERIDDLPLGLRSSPHDDAAGGAAPWGVAADQISLLDTLLWLAKAALLATRRWRATSEIIANYRENIGSTTGKELSLWPVFTCPPQHAHPAPSDIESTPLAAGLRLCDLTIE